jgi:ribosomal protein S18 acetylase RimI-like enzyme
MSNGVRQATTDEVGAISVTLAKLFADDPLMLHLTGGKHLAVDKLASFFAAFVKIRLSQGHVYTTPDHEAVAVWAPPGEWKITESDIARHSPTFIKVFGPRFAQNVVVLADLQKRHPTEPHYYLQFMGAAPDADGRGWATKLMQPMIEQADVEQVGLYVEASSEPSVALFTRFGFKVREELTHRRKGPTQWLMWREPILG